jgi:RHS repeat-associated protein
MSGHAGELIKDGANPNRWHLRVDDGTFVEHRTGAGNGAQNGEWWVATIPDGTQYWFGDRPGANSTLTVPVFGNHAGEPCHAATFAASSCPQAWRWTLDYVVDTHHNTMSYTYAKETNRYARNNTGTDLAPYDRANYPTTIDYGTRTDTTGPAPMRVALDNADRCLAGCATHDKDHWPDTPWDQECTASPCAVGAPTFWTTKRLTKVTTRVWNAATGTYRDVESWTLSQSFPDPGDGTRAGLWLDRISHTGLVGAAVSVPDVSFVGVQMPNRVDAIDQSPAMNWWRIKTINTETGGKIDVSYSPPDCVAGSRMPDRNALQDNTLRCYPVRWASNGQPNPSIDFFHKYVVTDVVEADLTGGAPRVLTHYDYVAAPAWHYTDDDGLIKPDDKTWSVWRGYPAVQTTVGDPGEQTRTEARYFRGMNGDHLPAGSRTVTLPTIVTGSIAAAADEDAFAGMVRESIVYNGPGGPEVSATVNEPWQSTPTASRTANGVTVNARHAGIGAAHTRTALDGGRATRTTTTTTAFDDTYGMAVSVDDRGDDTVTGDEKCTLTDYARNTAAWIVATVSRTRVFATDCAKAQGTGLTDDDVISDDRTSYDNQPWGAEPTKGEVTRIETLKAYNGGDPTYLTATTSSYDPDGRSLDVTDIRGNHTRTAYTPSTGGPVTQTIQTNPLGWTTTTNLEPAWGQATSTIDTNGRRTDLGYDALGRLTSVWLPGRDKASQTPNIGYAYLVRTTGPVVVTTRRLNAAGGYITSYALYDGLLRARQNQSPDQAGGSGAVVTDDYYDTTGRVSKANGTYLSTLPPGTDLTVPTAVVPVQTTTTYDGAGRVTAQILAVDAPGSSPGGTEKWRTTTGYGGDRTDTTPPAGGTVTSTVVDAKGRTTTLRQYHAGVAAGSADPGGYDATTYTYNRKDQLTRVTDAGGDRWSSTFDLRGRPIVSVDPDKGTSTSTFNDAGDLLSVTDARGTTLGYTYDAIGRKTSVRDGSPTGAKRAEWFYDTLSNGTAANGQLVKTARYAGTAAYTSEVLGFTADYRPSSTKYVIPDTETGLGGTYTYVQTYNVDGSPRTSRLPATGDLPTETLSDDYSALALPTMLSTTLGGTYVTGTEYTSFGEIGATHLRNNNGNAADVGRTYDTATRRLTQIWTTRQTAPTTIADVRYAYDPAGNITKIADLTAGDTQCTRTDHLRRLVEAWTAGNGDCAPAPSVAGLATGPAAYWQSYTYDVVGNRTSLVDHVSPAGQRTTTYTVPGGKHLLTSMSTVDNGGTRVASYGYDPDGNTLTRPAPATGTQTLTWDPEGHLATATDSGGTTGYLYDADGNRLIRRDPTGKTLYLPGQELHYSTGTGARTAIRYYGVGDLTVATRTAAGVTWLSTDHQDTPQIAVDAGTQAATITRRTPFGAVRGTAGAVPAGMERGYVGGTTDSTGLVHLGAREYDPVTGRFLSADPVLNLADPQQMHGYVYANDTPMTASDPTGLMTASACATRLCADQINAAAAVDTASQAASCTSRGCHDAVMGSNCHCNDRGAVPFKMVHGVFVNRFQTDPKWVEYAFADADQQARDQRMHNLLYGPDHLYTVRCGSGPYEDCEAKAEVMFACDQSPGACSPEFLHSLADSCGCGYDTLDVNNDVIFAAPGEVPGEGGGTGPRGGKRPGEYTRLSDPNPVPRVLRDQYEEVRLGNGTPRLDPKTGEQQVYRGDQLVGSRKATWKGSLEWDVPGTRYRILQRPDGRLGYVQGHDYENPQLFPGPWYQEGGPQVSFGGPKGGR